VSTKKRDAYVPDPVPHEIVTEHQDCPPLLLKTGEPRFEGDSGRHVGDVTWESFMHAPMSAAAKRAAWEAVKQVLEARYPGTIWTVVPEGEEPTPGASIFRVRAPDPTG
jgi:hypothetical protein